MVYYLGRDVKVYIATESTNNLFVHDTDLKVQSASSGATKFAGQRNDPMNADCQATDLTGVDLGIGVVDEDISFVGLRSVLKAEIKKETTLSLTRKKTDAVYDVIFNGDGTGTTGNVCRWGISGSVSSGSTSNVYTGLEKPTVNYGYRIHIQLKASGEIFVLRNCTITGHSTSVSADGVQEETLEFQSHVDPVISTSAVTAATLSTAL
tara:strand:+ start:1380 stop:2003 length:624 start_codon:yes stop_codon:yes gene_type:complete